MLKFLNLLLLFIAIALPTDHSTTTLLFSLNILGFKLLFTDIFFLFLLFCSVLLKKSYDNLDLFIGIFVFFVFITSVILCLFNSYLFKQLLYDFRPILYLCIFTFNKDFFYFKRDTIFFVILFGLFVYSIICFSYFILGPESSIIFQDMNLGRIVFHNDYLFIIGVPLVIYGVKNTNYSLLKRFACFCLLFCFSLKLFLSMGRGITFFVGFSVFIYLMKDLKRIKTKSFVFYISVFLTLFSTYKSVLGLLLGDSVDTILEYSESRYNTSSDGFQENQIDNRSTMFYTGFNEIKQSPIFGHGAGYTFKIDSKEWEEKVSFVDSSLLTALIRYGVIGAFFLYGIIILVLYRNYLKIKANLIQTNSIIKYVNTSLTIILIYTLFNSLLVASYSIIAFYWLVVWVYHNQSRFEIN